MKTKENPKNRNRYYDSNTSSNMIINTAAQKAFISLDSINSYTVKTVSKFTSTMINDKTQR